MRTTEERRAQLEKMAAEIQARLRGIEDTLEEEPPKDVEDRASEREDDEVLERLGLNGKHELEMIRAALRRIEDGTYGECAKCGEQISEERLDLLPFTPFCRACAV
ncbi:TraR/DksA family transcriptional regulator [Oceanibium sediminis]|uniref:TraR/DksA family transcriptional regulator n=1 Tax=Oceanibium sediminis TaxID=2026339 RepID=UPI000DD2E20B|nr:TraR/DksA family transcriptional regulator [Oceanibium sediminis]